MDTSLYYHLPYFISILHYLPVQDPSDLWKEKRQNSYLFLSYIDLVHQSSESRALRLITLVKEAGRRVGELNQLVSNPASANVSVSAAQQKDHEGLLQQWEFRHKLYKRMKAGYEHARKLPPNLLSSIWRTVPLVKGLERLRGQQFKTSLLLRLESQDVVD